MKLFDRIAARAARKPCRPFDHDIGDLIAQYEKLRTIDLRPHDRFIHACIQQALLAGNGGSFCIGAVIADRNGHILERARARVLQPYLRTDKHAEMNALTQLEDKHRFHSREQLAAVLSGSTLYTTLEPCPMCFTRWILSGVSKIVYAAADPPSGMAVIADRLPSIWLQLLSDSGKSFEEANCSPELKDFCREIFLRSQRAGGGKQWNFK